MKNVASTCQRGIKFIISQFEVDLFVLASKQTKIESGKHEISFVIYELTGVS